MDLETVRFGLPQLAVAQAHKEITHNEALVRIDASLHPAIEAVTSAPPTVTSVDAGKCWLVGAAPSGDFSSHEQHIAYWTGASWRFLMPLEGMRIWHRAQKYLLTFTDTGWRSGAPILPPTGGTVIDAECRAAVAALVTELTAAGVLRAV